MPPNTTVWQLKPHTRGKHLVLRHYMQAWLPIMTRWNGKVLFIDAFAGPGEYSGGEPGSPLIVLDALIEHNARNRMTSEIHFVFIEKVRSRFNHLQRALQPKIAQLPDNAVCHLLNEPFDETLTSVLDYIEEQNVSLAPSFVMIDPFGVSETPMNTIARILANPKSEVYISFMYETLNRFKLSTEIEPHLDDLFGCTGWRDGLGISDVRERKAFFFDLYESQLRVSGARQVLHFELYEGERLVYAIFHGTHRFEGCDKMKHAIWKVAPFGDYRFRGGRTGQLTFGDDLVDFDRLEMDLRSEFGPKGWVRIEDVTLFVKSDKTEFHSGHLKTKTLKPMEGRGEIEVDPRSRKRPGTYPDGTLLRFIV